MKSVAIFIADFSQLTRLGLLNVLKQINFPLSFHEIGTPEKLHINATKDNLSLLIISASFINSLSRQMQYVLKITSDFKKKVLIHDQEIPILLKHAFDEIIELNDYEKVIFRKLHREIVMLAKNADFPENSDELSGREKDVLKLVALGLTNREIADRLYISAHTVITHRKHISSKLGIKTIAGLTVYALINKLISPEELN
jgi:DNA-binding CsgD family transcriptional regulator